MKLPGIKPPQQTVHTEAFPLALLHIGETMECGAKELREMAARHLQIAGLIEGEVRQWHTLIAWHKEQAAALETLADGFQTGAEVSRNTAAPKVL